MDSIIINITNENIFFEKYFRGILINDFDITLNNDFLFYIEEIYGKINVKNYLQSLFINKNFREIENKLVEYGFKINGLIGIRGKILNEELKVLTNYKNWFNIFKIKKTN